MAQRKIYATTLETAFKQLTLDGSTMSGFEAYRQIDRLTKNRNAMAHAWQEPLYVTFLELALFSKSLSARTSGTTGPPKRVRIPRRDLVNSARITADTFDLKPGDRVLHCLPSDFIAGKMMIVRAFALSLDLHIIDPRGSILENLKIADRFRFTAMVPLQLHRAIHEDRARVERQFEMILLGGGPVSDALIEDLQGLSTQVYQGYGSTETVTHVAMRRLNGPEPHGTFKALGKVHFARDPRGCLVVYTPHLSVKQHVTNDLVELLDDTHFRWLGRWDHVILSGGKKIFPEQLEAKTAGQLPYPHYFSSMPDPVLGQAVVLMLETNNPQEEVLPEVMDRIMKILHPHEWPRRVIALKKIERTSSGKVKRQ